VEESDRIIGLELGADDYITKPFNPREVLARVRAVLRRTNAAQAIPSRRISVADLTLDLGEHTLTARGEWVELTPTEFKLLALFMENPGHTYTREELLEKTLGYSYEGAGCLAPGGRWIPTFATCATRSSPILPPALPAAWPAAGLSSVTRSTASSWLLPWG
jgi:hypothetical protein